MRKTLLFVVLCASLLLGQNINQWSDTTGIIDPLEADTIKYGSTIFTLTDGEDFRIICMTKDTSASGFSGDSVKFIWGYQTGCTVLNDSAGLDTAWEFHIAVDTMDSDSFGVELYGSTAPSTGAPTIARASRADTSSVYGYAMQTHMIDPNWNEFIRFWALGLADNTGSSNEILFAVRRRKFAEVRTW